MTESPSPARAPSTLARAVWGALSLLVAASVLLEGILAVTTDVPGVSVATRLVRFFSFFTIQSNLLVLATTLPLLRDPQTDGSLWRVARLDALLGITVTGLVFAVLLAPIYEPEGLAWWTNLGLHYVAPVLTLAGWVLFGPRGRTTGPVVGRALLWPFAWIAWTFAHGAATGWYPYPFLDVDQLGYAAALGAVAVIFGVALGILFLFLVVDRRLPSFPEERAPG